VSKTVNDLVGRMAERAKYLADLSIDSLRSYHPDVVGTGSTYECRQVTAGLSRGDLIAVILIEEFTEEFDKEIVQ
jgi:hypothetical protein